DIALAVQTAGLCGELINCLLTTQSNLDGVLRWHIRAQACTCHEIQAFNKASSVGLRSSEHHPASAVTRDAVCLGQSVVGDAQQIRNQGSHGYVLSVVVQDAVVDFISEHQQ